MSRKGEEERFQWKEDDIEIIDPEDIEEAEDIRHSSSRGKSSSKSQ